MNVDPSGTRSVEAIRADINAQRETIEWAKAGIAAGTLSIDAEFMFYMTLKLQQYEDELANASGTPVGSNPIVSQNFSSSHQAIDYYASIGSPIYSPFAGTVTVADSKVNYNDINLSEKSLKSYGSYVMIDCGNGMEILFAHLSSIDVQVDQVVSAWDIIGTSGNTGRSFGPHLHFEVYINGLRQNPAEYLP